MVEYVQRSSGLARSRLQRADARHAAKVQQLSTMVDVCDAALGLLSLPSQSAAAAAHTCCLVDCSCECMAGLSDACKHNEAGNAARPVTATQLLAAAAHLAGLPPTGDLVGFSGDCCCDDC